MKKNNNIHILERSQVNMKLTQGLLTPLTIVTSPMGYGKTTAVKAFLQKRKNIVIWSTMTSTDIIANSEYFWLLLTKEIFKISPELAQNLEERGFPSDSAQIFRFLDIIKNFPRKTDGTIVVVIDDYYLIEKHEINTLIHRTIQEEIPWLRFILITRRIPELPIEEMVAKDLCTTIDFDDLTFSYEDAVNYFQLIGFSGDATVQKQIYEDSKGWITALYLMSKSYFNGRPMEDLKKMLKVSLFDTYDPVSQEALVKLSYFNTIAPKQAAYIFDDYNIALQLEQLYKDNAFITKDADNNYKFHQIFLNFLHDEQTKHNFDLKEIYHRAGEWFAMNNDHMMAFHYWQLAGDYCHILGSLEIADISHINSLDRKLIFPMFNLISEELWYQYPIATLKYIFLLMLYNEDTRAMYLLDEFDEHFKKNKHSKYHCDQLLAESQIIRTSLAFNDMSQIIIHSKAAYELLNGKVSLLRKRSGVYTYGCPHFSYMYYNKPGNYQSLIQQICNGFDYHIKACNGCGAGASPLSSAEYYLETGKFEKVESLALEARYIARQYEQTCIMIASLFTLSRLYQIQGRELELNQTIEQMEDLCQVEKNPLNSNVLDNALGYLYTLLGNIEKIPAWLREDSITYCFSTYQGTAFNHLVYQMTLIQQKDYETFLKNKHTFLMDFKQFQNQLGIAFFTSIMPLHFIIQKAYMLLYMNWEKHWTLLSRIT